MLSYHIHPKASRKEVRRSTLIGLEVCFICVYVQMLHGIPMDQQVLTMGSGMIHGDDSIKLGQISGFSDHCNVTVSGRLLGGKPVKVKMMTNHLPCGSQVTIDIEEDASKDEIKMKLAEATGVPVEHQKVMLSGINQIVMGDKR